MFSDPTQLYYTLVAVGLVLLALEVFLPGGIMGIVGGLVLALAILTGFFAFGPKGGLFAAIALIGFSALFLGVWIRVFPKTPMGKTLMLQRDGHDFKTQDEAMEKLVGTEGVAQTDLRPAGIAILGGRRTDVVAESGFVTAATRIRVIHVEGNRIVVRPIDA